MSAITDVGLAELRRFGWTLGPEFEQRYHTDAWVYNLVNALEKVATERDTALSYVDVLCDEIEDHATERTDAAPFIAARRFIESRLTPERPK